MPEYRITARDVRPILGKYVQVEFWGVNSTRCARGVATGLDASGCCVLLNNERSLWRPGIIRIRPLLAPEIACLISDDDLAMMVG